MGEACPCQSGKTYQDCCQPYHLGEDAPDAESLMRSRYSAFVLGNIDYIVKTTFPRQQSAMDIAALKKWAQEKQWQGLCVLKVQDEFAKNKSSVEFEAYFAQDGVDEIHHEKSLFIHQNGRIYFLDPTLNLPAEKSPCVCGSGRKFKLCCGKLLQEFYC